MPYVNWRGENIPGGVFFSHSFLGNLDGTPVLRIVTETLRWRILSEREKLGRSLPLEHTSTRPRCMRYGHFGITDLRVPARFLETANCSF